ncbi:lanthionine synthetase LanC family protein [Rheinheimera riviphila]|nr:lanthionine synthetase LanC family protein [Rheinheimera riviphila]
MTSATVIQHYIHQIQKQTASAISECTAPGLLTGKAGILLFLYHTAYSDQNLMELELDVLYQHLHSEQLDYSYCNGIAGICWFLEHLNQHNSVYDPDMLNEVDTLLTHVVHKDLYGNEIELLQGLSGISAYFAKRSLRTDQSKFYELYLAKITIKSVGVAAGSCWEQPEESVFRNRPATESEYNLGFAHGIPGIIACIAPALRYPSCHAHAQKLLGHAYRWLQFQARPTACRYGYLAGDTALTRPGWCYGDLTIAVSGLQIARLMSDTALAKSFLDLAFETITNAEAYAKTDDLTLCHGHASLYVLYLKMYQLTDEYIFRLTAEQHKTNLLKELPLLLENSSTHDCSFLNGLAGIGLALSSCINNLDWLDVLMVINSAKN